MKSDLEKRVEMLENLLPLSEICDRFNSKLNDIELRLQRLESSCRPYSHGLEEIRRRASEAEVEFDKYRIPRDHYASNAVVDDGK